MGTDRLRGLRHTRLCPWLAGLLLFVSTPPVFSADAPGLQTDPAFNYRSSRIPETTRVLKNVPFAETPQGPLTLDLYLPEKPSSAPMPVLVWFHGGGWTGGTPDEFVPNYLIGQGYAFVGARYRFSQQALYPAQIHDVKGAIRWVRAHAKEYDFDSNRIGAIGLSAGGHLVALLGTTGGVKELEGDTGGNLEFSSRVEAVCDMSGPTDFFLLAEDAQRQALAHRLISQLLGGALEEKKDLAKTAMPATYISKSVPPFLIIHGGMDPLLLPSQAEALHKALRKGVADSTLFIVPRAGHVFGGPVIEGTVLRFFDRHLMKGE